jgi:uridine kinase
LKKITAQIIAICGGSGSGKTTLARKFIGAAVISTDSFYKDISDLLPKEDGTFDFDHPNAIDLAGCAQACLKLAAGEDVTIPVYDMRSATRTGEQIVAAPIRRIVVIEGIFSFHSPIQDVATLKIFIDTPIDQRMARRIRRDSERGRSTMDTIRHSLQVEDAYTRYIEPMRDVADLILMGEEMRGGFLL